MQLYVSQLVCSDSRPTKELKAFKKVFLKLGKEKFVELKAKVKDFAFYNDKTSSWKLEPCEFVLHFGTSSKDILDLIKIQAKL